RCQYRGDEPGIDRMAYKPVRAGIDDPMALFSRNLVRPKTSEMNSCPPREQDSRQDNNCKHIRNAIAGVPKRAFAQDLRNPRREQDSSNDDEEPVNACTPGHWPLDRSSRPE